MRALSLALFAVTAAGLIGNSVRADLPVAPPPREIRPDGTRDPVPKPEPTAKAEDPAVVVERIIKNSKEVGERLEKTDTGTDTRKTQEKILKDIEALINRQEDPPKNDDKKDDKKDDNQKNMDMKNMDMMKDMMKDNMPPPNMGMMPMDKMNMDKMGMGMQNGMPMGGMDKEDQPMGRKPRMGEPKPDGDHKPDPMNTTKQNPMDPKEPKDPNPKNPMGGTAGPGGKLPPKGVLPFEDELSKDVWGHLPPKLRQEMTQYYKEDVMPKYAELLKLYYSSLSEKDKPGPVPPKK